MCHTRHTEPGLGARRAGVKRMSVVHDHRAERIAADAPTRSGAHERIGNPVAHVLADDVMGMKRALEHLVQLGHKRFAYANARATYLTHYSVAERLSQLLVSPSGFDEGDGKLNHERK